MNLQTCARGNVIFREGDPGDCMFDIQFGKIGIYKNYGTEDEKLISELFPGQLFGEMGLLDHAPRSATAVALEDGTILEAISEEEFYAYFEKQPAKVLLLMQQMCSRLRRTTKDYMTACRTVYETAEAEKKGEEKSSQLMARIQRFCDLALGFDSYMYY